MSRRKEGGVLAYPLSYLVQRCLRCQVRNPATHLFFPKDSRQSKGVRSVCKKCTHARTRWLHHNNPKRKEYKRQYRKKKAKEIAEYQKKYYQENKERLDEWKRTYNQENKEAIAEQKKAYRLKNAEKISSQRKKHYKENRERILEERKKYYEENIEHIKRYREQYIKEGRARGSDYRKRVRRLEVFNNLPADFTAEEWEEALEFFDYLCCYCGLKSDGTLEQDHFIPLSKMGSYTKDNIVPACKSCNSSKHAQDFQKWYRKHKHYSPKREHLVLSYIEIRKREEHA